MNKCKKTILLVFGFLFIMAIFFIPFEKEAYLAHDALRLRAKIPKEYGGYWEIIGELKKVQLDEFGFQPLPLFIANRINHMEFLKWKKQKEDEWKKIQDKWDKNKEKTFETEELYLIEREFYLTYGGKFIYNKFRVDFFITELAIVFLVGIFAYILVCVVLRRPEKTGEKRTKIS